jgi:sugar (pentulose or hexulose) kinase
MGKVSVEAARICGQGLKSGIPIVSGGPDFITALIGTKTVRPGDVCDRAGSSEGINVCAVEAQVSAGLRVLPHAASGLWNVGALIADSGRLFEWYRKAAGFEERPYGDLLEELIPSGYDPGIFAGDFFTPSVKAFPPLHDKTRLGRSVLSTIGFSVRSAIERLERSAFPVKEMRVSGGHGKNPRWNQLKADISGVSLLVPEIPDGELAGNAVLAASALGSEPCTVDFLSAAQKMIRFREVYKPTDETASFWDERYRLYKLHIGEVYGV